MRTQTFNDVARKNDSTLRRVGGNLWKVREERGWSEEGLAFKPGYGGHDRSEHQSNRTYR